nr:MAG TPA: hypothetical protein [Caudoviricetes sp.]
MLSVIQQSANQFLVAFYSTRKFQELDLLTQNA